MITNNLPLFPEITLSATELIVVAEKLTDPAVRKYFHKLGYDMAVQLVTYNEPAEGQTAEEFLRKRMNMQGQLDTVNTLLLIER